LDNGRTACTSAEEDEAVPRPNIAEASGLAASVDDDDDLCRTSLNGSMAFTPSKSILKHFMIFITEVDGGGRPLRPLWLGHRRRSSVDFRETRHFCPK